MPTDTNRNIFSAITDFRQLRFRAKLEQILARWSGGSNELLAYEEVRQKLKATGQVPRGLQDIPIDAIVGSVGRYTDFTRTFLPRQDSDATRWAKVKMAMTDMVGLPPIEVYQIDQAYFVLDGNHRVSVARQLGAKHIQAYVTEVKTDVPLESDVQPDDLILKAEYAEFLNLTQCHKLLPDADLSVSVPGQYNKLETHISVHRYFMGINQQREVPYPEAVVDWYNTVYLPVAKAIREQGMLSEFPGRTEADLYLWVMEYRAELADTLGAEVEPALAADDLKVRFGTTPQRVVERVSKRILNAVMPEGLALGPAPGQWQKLRQNRARDRLFADILVPIDGTEKSWEALAWAVEAARREEARLHGLHVTSLETEAEQHVAQSVREAFKQRCSEAGIVAELIEENGKVSQRVYERARWMDLVVLSLSHPYSPHPLARLGSGLHPIIRRCPTPVVAVPKTTAGLKRILLAYDDGPKAREALFVATYLAGQWHIPLTLLAVTEETPAATDPLAYAEAYLEEHAVQVTYLHERGPVAQMILIIAEEQSTDLIIMGGYSRGPVAALSLGSTVESVLRSSAMPVLVCQ